MRQQWVMVAAVAVVATVSADAQRPQVGNNIKRFVTVDAPVVALTHAKVLDGTGAPARSDQTLILRDGRIAAIGASASTPVPEGATVLDLTGKTVMPGMVMMHEHLYYPTGPGVYGQLGESFTQLYLAGGVTAMRTGGNVHGTMDINMKRLIDSGAKPGPWMDATAPYLNGPNTFQQMRALTGPEDARRQVNYWADEGATSFKAYMNISREDLAAAISEAHKRGLKVTGHLCSVTYAEAAELGIDNLEHSFLAATDFVADKKANTCPGQATGQRTIAALEPASPEFLKLVRILIDMGVTLTTTPAVFETFTPGRPLPPGLEVLVEPLREQFVQNHTRAARNTQSIYTTLFSKGLQLDLAFFRAGGKLVAGTDPTGGGGVIPGFSNQRTIELLVEAGFTVPEAIQVVTLNGARYLGRDTDIGSLVAGKQADLVIINGDVAATVSDIRKVETVFKQGIGFDSARLIANVTGRVGIY